MASQARHGRVSEGNKEQLSRGAGGPRQVVCKQYVHWACEYLLCTCHTGHTSERHTCPPFQHFFAEMVSGQGCRCRAIGPYLIAEPSESYKKVDGHERRSNADYHIGHCMCNSSKTLLQPRRRKHFLTCLGEASCTRASDTGAPGSRALI